MSELNVPGIKSELILSLEKWMGPLKQAIGDSKILGGELDKGLVAASRAASEALGKAGKEAGDFGKAADAAADEADRLAKSNAAIKPPPLPAPTNVINWGAGLRSLAGIAGTVSPALGQMVSGFTAVEGAAAAAGVSLTAALGPIAAVVAALTAAKAAFEFGFGGVKMAADFEQTSLSFEILTGSADKAAKMLAELQDLANKSPLKMNEVADAGRQLLAMGVAAENVRDNLRMIGDVSTLMGQPLKEMAYIFGQVASQQKASTEDLNQFASRGVPIYRTLASILNTDVAGVKELAAEGKISFELVEKSFKKMTSEGGAFANGMARFANTLNGLLSSLSDQWEILQLKVGKAIGHNIDFKAGINAISDVIAGMAPTIVALYDVWSGMLKSTWTSLQPIIGAGKDMWKQWEELRKLFSESIGVELPSALKLVETAMALPLLPAKMLLDVVSAIAKAISYASQKATELIDVLGYLIDDDKYAREMKKLNAPIPQVNGQQQSSSTPSAAPPRPTTAGPDWAAQVAQSRARAAAGSQWGPSVGGAAQQRAQALTSSSPQAVSPGASNSGGGIMQGVNVAVGINVEQLSEAVARKAAAALQPVAESAATAAVAKLGQQLKVQQLTGAVRRGL